ncbi:MAG: hypothetical protein ACLQPD_15550 [Desulfomonilaceae bacterium]
MTHIALLLATAVLVFQIYFWGTRLWEIAQTARTVPEIDPERESQLPPKPPLISIIVPARDEQTGIGACLQSVLDQDYPLQWRGTTYGFNRYEPTVLDPTASQRGYSGKRITAAEM